MKTVYLSSGEKGGAGKTVTAILAAETLYAKNGPDNMIAVETDASNPDFGRRMRYLAGLQIETANLREQNGWIELSNLVEKAPNGATLIVNLPSQVELWDREIPVLADAFEEIGVDVTVFWTINRQRDSLILLEKARAAATTSWKWVVCKNTYWGKPEEFQLCDIWNAEKKLPVVLIPKANDLFIIHIMTRPGCFSTLETTLDDNGNKEYTAHERSTAKQMLRSAAEQFSTVL